MTDYEVALSLLDFKQRYSESKVKSNPNLVNQIKSKISIMILYLFVKQFIALFII